MVQEYAPPLGESGPLGPLDPNLANAYALALAMHEGRYLCVPRIKKVTTPVAGAEWTIQVPGGVTWLVLGITGTFTADATVSTRQVTVGAGDGTTTPLVAVGSNNGANQAPTYSFTRGVGNAVNAPVGTGATIAGLWDTPLPSGYTISSRTVNIQAADAWSAISMLVVEIRERTPNERAEYIENLLSGRPTTDYPGLLLGL